jgi:polyhydroxybutyrate depolymerase
VLAALVTALLGAAGCSDQVDVGVDGVDARWIDVPGTDGRQALLVTDDSKTERSSAGRPLIVVLHGLGQDAEHMAGIGGWPALARDKRAVVAFGEGSENSWNAGTCCGQAAASKVDDVAYLDSLIDEVVRRTGADRSAVYMAGFSNGGMMTYRYLCEGGVALRGAASLAGTDVDGCTPSRPTNFLQISGSADTVVPVDNTASVAADLGPLVPVGAAVMGVAAGFDCPDPVTTRATPVTKMTSTRSRVWATRTRSWMGTRAPTRSSRCGACPRRPHPRRPDRTDVHRLVVASRGSSLKNRCSHGTNGRRAVAGFTHERSSAP